MPTYPVLRQLVSEATLNWRFIKGDLAAVVLPGFIFTATALHVHSSCWSDWAIALGRGMFYFGLWVTAFCISNQLVGIEEDRLNKPDRPLVSGAVSYRGAWVRFMLSLVLIIVTGKCFGVLDWALLWVICTALYNFGRLSRHWLTKNLLVAVGMLSTLAAAWQMVAPLTSTVWQWIAVVGGIWLVLAHLSDLRDVEGDRAIGRNTFSLIFGEMTSRILLALGFGLLPLVIHLILISPVGNNVTGLLWDGLLAIVSWSIAVRILAYRTSQADHQTYTLFTGWYCLMLTSSFFTMSP